MLYEMLSPNDWFCMYKQSSTDFCYSVVTDSLNQAIPCTCYRKSKLVYSTFTHCLNLYFHKIMLHPLLIKWLILTLITSYVIILFYIPHILKILEFCWVLNSVFIITLTTYFLKIWKCQICFDRLCLLFLLLVDSLLVLYSTLVHPNLCVHL
jgi:hypothetical protein